MNSQKAIADGVEAFAQAVAMHRTQTGDWAHPLTGVSAKFDQSEGTVQITGSIGGCGVAHTFEVRLGQQWRVADGMGVVLAVWAIDASQRACRHPKT